MAFNESYKRWHKPTKQVFNESGSLKKGQTHQGYFSKEDKLLNPQKYLGDPNLIIFRSSWEYSFIKWADASPSIVRWSSEPMKVPYYDRVSKLDECKKLGLDPNNPRNWVVKNYNLDFWIEIDKGGQRPEKWFVEVKPKDKLVMPVPPDRGAPLKEQKRFNMLAKEYLINEAKFAALDAWAKKNGAKFYIFTEDVMIALGILRGRFQMKNNKK
jgi:hypothetical protein